MEIHISSGVGGQWLDKKALKGGEIAKLKTEAVWVEGQNGKQLVAKIRVKMDDGSVSEEQNVAINKPSQAALVQAFGKDTLAWIDKPLTVHAETGIFAGKRGVMMCLVPEGYVVAEDAAGFIVIRPKVEPPSNVARQIAGDELDLDDIPF